MLATFITIFVIPALMSSCSSCGNNGGDEDELMIEDSVLVINDSDTLVLDTEVARSMRLVMSKPAFADGKYSFTVRAADVPDGAKVSYKVCKPFGDKAVIAESEDGKFKDLPYSEDESTYAVIAIAKKGGEIVAQTEDVATGFIKQEAVSKAMTVDELQRLIDKQDESLLGAGENAFLSPDVKLVFSGLDADDVAPTVMGDVFSNLKMRVWDRVTVVSIKHDSMNRVSEIQLKVSY